MPQPSLGNTCRLAHLRTMSWNGHVVLFDAQMDADGRGVILVSTLSAFVKTAQVPNCSQLRAKPYAVVAHTGVQPA